MSVSGQSRLMSVSKRPRVKSFLVIDSTGLKVFGEGEWKVQKARQRAPSYLGELHLAVDCNTMKLSVQTCR